MVGGHRFLVEYVLKQRHPINTPEEWSGFVLEHCPSAWLRHMFNSQGQRLVLEVYDKDQAFHYRTRWT